MDYVGRFAPSPTGPLHAGSMVAALASWLDARAHAGRWLVRLEDTDTPRCVAGAAETILAQLDALGLRPDAPPLWQSSRGATYQRTLDALLASGDAYRCGCTRREVDEQLAAAGVAHQRHEDRVYPGTCRRGLNGKAARAVRLLTEAPAGGECVIEWADRRLGVQRQNVTRAVGDFVLQRADGLWAYQLAVVVDDADQGITHIVRGEDLADNTPRQILLQRALELPTPRYLHTPLVLATDGQKLSKQNGAAAVATSDEQANLATLRAAGAVLGLRPEVSSAAAWLAAAAAQWRAEQA